MRPIANKEAILAAINLMEWVKVMQEQQELKLFNMACFQQIMYCGKKGPLVQQIAHTPEEVISCGTACCFSGWIAVDPWFRKRGIIQNNVGAAIAAGTDHTEVALSKLFGVPLYVVSSLVYTSNIYRDVKTPADIIHVLQDWLFYYSERYLDEYS